MRTRLLLLLVAAATLYSCHPTGRKIAYYTFVNETDKIIVVNLYDQDYYESPAMQIPEDAEPIYSFTIAAGKNFTKILPPAYNGVGKNSILDPFDDIKAGCISVSNGELIIVQSYRGFLCNGDSYEITQNTEDATYLQYIFTEEFFNDYGLPVPVYD